MKNRVTEIQQQLLAAYPDAEIEIIDNSHLHAGHAGAKDGKGHFKLIIRSAAFADKSLVATHREIYQTLDSLMKTDIHALEIDAGVI